MNRASNIRKISVVGDVLTNLLLTDQKTENGLQICVHHEASEQIMQVIDAYDGSSDALIIHLSPKFFNFSLDTQSVIQQAEQLLSMIKNKAAVSSGLIILNTVGYPPNPVVSVQGLKNIKCVNRINEMFIDAAMESLNLRVIDLQKVCADYGWSRCFNDRNFRLFRSFYTKSAAEIIDKEYKKFLSQFFLERKKVIIVDADNTLWKGVIGEDGEDGIDIYSDYPGSIFREFQEYLMLLKDSGMILGMVTKNNYDDISSVFSNIQMPLSISDFSVVKANWRPKSENIKEIINDLNLGSESIVFFDDSDFELSEVKNSLPGISVIKFDVNRVGPIENIFEDVPLLSAWDTTQEDNSKTQKYKDHLKRENHRSLFHSFESYLQSINIEVECFLNEKSHIKRISQLCCKTNQFNSSLARYSELDIRNLMETGLVFSFSVKDDFGDLGIVASVIVVNRSIDTYIVSCRALGRKIEHDILAYLCNNYDLRNITFGVVKGPKNKQVFQFAEDFGFEKLSSGEDSTVYNLNLEHGLDVKYNFTEMKRERH